MALVTSESEGSSVEAEASAVAEDDSMSNEAELVPGEWLRACSKCSFQRNRTSSSFSHGEPSALFILTGLERFTRDLFDCFKCRAQPIALKIFLNFVDNCC